MIARAATAAAFCLLATELAVAQTAFTDRDYFQIKQRVYAASCGLDSGADAGRAYAENFTAEGAYVDAEGTTHHGSDALSAVARRDPSGVKGLTNAEQFLASPRIETTDFGAVANTLVLISVNQPPAKASERGQGKVLHIAKLQDELVRSVEGWKIRRRTIQTVNTPPLPGPTVTSPPIIVTDNGSRGSGGPAASLSGSDYAAIEQLYSHYTLTYDTGADKGYAWADLFTPDGSHVNPLNKMEFLQGREALAAFGAGKLRLGTVVEMQPKSPALKNLAHVRHNVANVVLETTPGGALAKAYLLYVVNEPTRTTFNPGGLYIDRLVKTPDGWRFKEKGAYMLGVPGPDAQPEAERRGK